MAKKPASRTRSSGQSGKSTKKRPKVNIDKFLDTPKQQTW